MQSLIVIVNVLGEKFKGGRFSCPPDIHKKTLAQIGSRQAIPIFRETLSSEEEKKCECQSWLKDLLTVH